MLKKNAFRKGNEIDIRFFARKKKRKTHFELLAKAFLIYMIPAFLICACLGFNGYRDLEAEYHNLETDSLSQIRILEQTVSLQQVEIDRYRNRISVQNDEIDKFAGKLKILEMQLADLNSFEKKIRGMAKNELAGGEPLFGIGGSEEEADLKRSAATPDFMIRRMNEHAGRLSDVSTDLKDSFEVYLSAIDLRNKRFAATPSITPVKGRITSKFGYRTSPFSGVREYHKGIDIAAAEGTSIKAAADGVITFSGRKGLLGNLITIDHGNGIVTRYGHISRFVKKRGQRVKKGDTIARVGDTGRSTGPHLHYEVRISGKAVDPKKYMRFRGKS